MRRDLALVVVAGTALVGVLAVASTASAAGKNLKHFPKDISGDDLQANMKTIQGSLGVKCGYCHVVVPTKKFEAETPKKKVALSMLDMTAKISKELFTWKDAPKATCYMCHKGEEEPQVKAPKEKEEKVKAFDAACAEEKHAETVKAMKALVEKLNKSYFTWKDAPKATCWMCHRGEKEPKLKAAE